MRRPFTAEMKAIGLRLGPTLVLVAALSAASAIGGEKHPPGSEAARADVRKDVAEACEFLRKPPSPTSAALTSSMNKLASTLWYGWTGIEVKDAEAELMGRMLRDIAAQKYDWTQLDVREQMAEFRRWASTYKLSENLSESIVNMSATKGMPVMSRVLVLPCGDADQHRDPSEEQRLYQYWHDAARKQCSVEQIGWERSRDAYAKLTGGRPVPTTLGEHKVFAQLCADRGALAECKGDYWLAALMGVIPKGQSGSGSPPAPKGGATLVKYHDANCAPATAGQQYEIARIATMALCAPVARAYNFARTADRPERTDEFGACWDKYSFHCVQR